MRGSDPIIRFSHEHDSFPTRSLTFLLTLATAVAGCQEPQAELQPHSMNTDQTVLPPEGKSFAILAGGCFWCTEAIYAEMQGVDKVESGYTGGHIKNPGYREICTGRTGHAEAVRITFDPTVVTFGELLEVFWRTHDPTTLNRRGRRRHAVPFSHLPPG